MKKIAFLPLLFILSCTVSEKEDSLRQLDSEIKNSKIYEEKLLFKTDSLRTLLTRSSSPDERWRLALELFESFERYNVDSCCRYAALLDTLAGDDNNRTVIAKSALSIGERRSWLTTQPERHLEMLRDTDNLDSTATSWYYRAKFMLFAIDRPGYKKSDSRFDIVREFWQKDSSSREAILLRGVLLNHEKNYEGALKIFHDIMESDRFTLNMKARAAIFTSRIHHRLGDDDKYVEYLVKSAIYDLQDPSREYDSIYNLALYLYDQGDIYRACEYLNKSISDGYEANFPKSQLRSTKSVVIFNNALHAKRKANIKTLVSLLVVLSILALVIATLLLVLRKFSRRQSATLKRLSSINASLVSTKKKLMQKNSIQEKFLGKYMELSARYMGAVDEERMTMRRILKEEGVDKLRQMLRRPSYISGEYDNYYQYFDNAFLGIFPDFITNINTASPLTQSTVTFDGKSLSTGARILALIRLDIVSPERISAILGISTGTVYTYLYRLRKMLGCKSPDLGKLLIELIP